MNRTFIVEIILRAREEMVRVVEQATSAMEKLTSAEREHGKVAGEAAEKLRGEVSELERLREAHVREKKGLDDAVESRRKDATAIRNSVVELERNVQAAREAGRAHLEEANRLATLARRRQDATGKTDALTRSMLSQSRAQRQLAGEQNRLIQGYQREVAQVERRARALELDARATERQSSALSRAISSTTDRIGRLRSEVSEVDRSGGRLRQFFRDVREGARSSDVNLARLSASLRGFQIAFVIKYAQALLSVLVGLAGALFSVAASAAQAGAALVGGLAAGASQAIPVVGLLVAVVGRVTAVLKALKLQNDQQLVAGRQQEQAAERQRAAAERVRNAQESLSDANRRVTDAVRELTQARHEARRELEDLVDAERRAQLQSESASLSVEEAQARLRQAIATGAGEDVARAQLGVREAREDRRGAGRTATRARQDLTTFRAEGAEGVARAEEALADASRQAARAGRDLAEARRKSGSALDQEAAAADRLQEMLKQLSPAERRLFDALTRLQATYRRVVRPITDIIVDAVARAVDRIERLLRDNRITNAFRGLAQQIARQMDHLLDVGTGGESRGFLVFLVNEARRNLPIVTGILEKLFGTARNLARVAAPAFRDLLEMIDGYAGEAEKASKPTKRLSDFFRDGVKHLKAWVDLGLAAIDVLLALAGAGGAATGLDIIRDGTRRLHQMADAIRDNRSEVGKFFDEARDVLGNVISVIVALGREIINTFSTRNVHTFSEFLNGVVIPAIGATIEIMGLLTSFVHALLSQPVIREVAQWAATFILLAKGFTILRGAVVALRGIVTGFVATFGLLPALVLAAIAAIVLLDRRFHFLGPTFRFIKRIAGDVFDWLKGAAREVADFFSDVWSRGLLKWLRWPFEHLTLPFLKASIGVAIDVAKVVIGFFGGNQWRGVRSVVAAPFRLAKGIIESLWDAIRSIVKAGLRFVRGDIRGARDSIVDGFRSIANRVKSVWESIFGTIYRIVATVINGIISGVNAAIGALNKLPGPNVGRIRFHMPVTLESARTLSEAERGEGGPDIPASKLATGGMLRARPGGHRAVIGEEGYDEVVLSSNPRYAGRTRALLSRFLEAAPHVIAMAQGGYVQGARPPVGDNLLKILSGLFRMGFNVTSGRRPSGGTWHQAGYAVDFGDSVNNLQRLWSILYPARRGFEELYGPTGLRPGGGLYERGGRFRDADLQAGHQDHVHLAVLDAGVRLARALGNALGGGVAQLPAFFRAASGGTGRWLDRIVGRRPRTGSFASGGLQAIWRQSRNVIRGLRNRATDLTGDFAILGGGGGSARNMEIGRRMAAARGWEGAQWTALRSLGTGESGWDETARNRGSGAFGIGQFLGDTLRAYARHGATSRSPGRQINAMLQYISDRYGDPISAYRAWLSRTPHWYELGGPVRGSGPVSAMLHGGEHIWTAGEVARAGGHGIMRAMRRMLGGGGQGGPYGYQLGGEAQATQGPVVRAVAGSARSLERSLGEFLRIIADLAAGMGRSRRLAVRLRRAFGRALEEGGPLDRIRTEIEAIGTRVARALQRAQFRVRGGVAERAALTPAQLAQQELAGLGAQRAGLGQQGFAVEQALGTAQEARALAGARLRAARPGSRAARQAQTALDQATARVNQLRGLQNEVATALAQNAQDMVEKQEQFQQALLDEVNQGAERQTAALDRASRLATALGRAINPQEVIDRRIAIMREQIGGLGGVLAQAERSGNQALAQQIRDQIADLDVAIAEAGAERFQAAIDAVNQTASRELAANDVRARLAEIGQTDFVARGAALRDRGGILERQRTGLLGLLAQASAAGNVAKVDELTQSISELDVSIAENTQAVKDNTNAAFAAQVEQIQTAASFSQSVLGGAQQFFTGLGQLTGQNFTQSILATLTGQGTALQTQRTGLLGSLADLLGLGGAERENLVGLSGADLVNTLLTMTSGPIFQSILDRLDPTQEAAFRELINALIGNASATTENTQAINEASGQSMEQSFNSPFWINLRQAIFTGAGTLLPQYAAMIPHAQSGGRVVREGVLYAHAGEDVIPAGVAGEEHTHFHITSPTVMYDHADASRQAAFYRRVQGRRR